MDRIEFVYWSLWPGGLNFWKNKINPFLIFFNICLYITQFSLVMTLIIQDFSLLSILNGIEALSPITFASVKCIGLCIKFHDLQRALVKLRHNCWDVEKCAPNESSLQDCRNALNYFKYFTWFLHTLKFFVVMVFLVPLIFNRGEEIIPYAMYRPEAIPPIFLWIFQFYLAWTMYFYNIGFDVLSFTAIMLVFVQFKLINGQLLALDFTKIHDPMELAKMKLTVKKIVDHHNWLINYMQELNECVSLTILVLFIVEAVGMSMELYSVSVTNPTVTVLFRAAAFGGTIFFQVFFLHCLPSDTLQQEAYAMSYNIYRTNWYLSTNTQIVKDLTMIMNMSIRNNNIKLKAWKLFDVDLPAFAMIVRSAMSYYTLIKTFTEV